MARFLRSYLSPYMQSWRPLAVELRLPVSHKRGFSGLFLALVKDEPKVSLAILFSAHMLQPIDHLAVEPLLNGDVRHGCRGRRPVPVLLARRKPHHATRMDLLDRAALPLDPAAAGRDDERLPERVRVPGRPGP